MIHIRPIHSQDALIWATLRHDLWSDASFEHHAEEIASFFAGTLDEPVAVLVYESKQDGIIAFIDGGPDALTAHRNAISAQGVKASAFFDDISLRNFTVTSPDGYNIGFFTAR